MKATVLAATTVLALGCGPASLREDLGRSSIDVSSPPESDAGVATSGDTASRLPGEVRDLLRSAVGECVNPGATDSAPLDITITIKGGVTIDKLKLAGRMEGSDEESCLREKTSNIHHRATVQWPNGDHEIEVPIVPPGSGEVDCAFPADEQPTQLTPRQQIDHLMRTARGIDWCHLGDEAGSISLDLQIDRNGRPTHVGPRGRFSRIWFGQCAARAACLLRLDPRSDNTSTVRTFSYSARQSYSYAGMDAWTRAIAAVADLDGDSVELLSTWRGMFPDQPPDNPYLRLVERFLVRLDAGEDASKRAEKLFTEAEKQLAELEKLEIKGRKKRIDARTQKGLELASAFEKQYRAVQLLGWSEWSTAAAYRIGETRQILADAVLAAPVPPGRVKIDRRHHVTPDPLISNAKTMSGYRRDVFVHRFEEWQRQLVTELRSRSLEAHRVAAQIARERGISDEWTKKTDVAIETLQGQVGAP